VALAGSGVLAGCGRLGPDGPTAKEADDGGPVAVVIEGESITVGEVDELIRRTFYEELMRQPAERIYEARETAIRVLVEQRIVDDAARERGSTPDALEAEIKDAVPDPSVEEVTAWYAENESRLRGAPFEDIAPQIRDHLAEQRRHEAWQAFIAPRLEALSVEMVLSPPRRELEATRLIRGPSDAPITIMAFSDYQCPYCIRSEPVLAEVLERYPEDVRLIHRHFPLDGIHPFARPAAEAAMCADEQERFWDYHDAIFARRGQLGEGSLDEIANELELDLERFRPCVEERRYAEFVNADLEAGRQAGVTGTPAFFVNGIALKGARDADELSRVVEAELTRVDH